MSLPSMLPVFFVLNRNRTLGSSSIEETSWDLVCFLLSFSAGVWGLLALRAPPVPPHQTHNPMESVLMDDGGQHDEGWATCSRSTHGNRADEVSPAVAASLRRVYRLLL